MDLLDSIFTIFSMLGGLGVFMFGMKLLGDSLEIIAGSKMKKMFEKVSNNRFKGFGIGVGVTGVIQSSSATSVMLVGFVNVGFLSLKQATPILLGAIVGTTVTAQLSSLSAFNITAIMSLLAAIGAFMVMFTKNNDRTRHVGMIMLGFGMLFIGLSLMSSSMKSFAFDSSGAPTAFAEMMLTFKNPLLCVLLGMLFTAIIQSSSASTGVMVALATAGMLVDPKPAMYMVLGTHIGTCITAILASIGTSINAKRTAGINLSINIIGTALWLLILLLAEDFFAGVMLKLSGGVIERVIANFHTISNLITALILLPFVNPIVAMIEKFLPDRKKLESSSKRLYYLDERIFKTPSIAVLQSMNEVKNMGDMAMKNLNDSIDMLLSGDTSKQVSIATVEETINYLNIEITNYLVRFAALDLSKKDDVVIGSLFHVVSDIERIGDYAENIMKSSIKLSKSESNFSEEAKAEIVEVRDLLNVLYKETMQAFMRRDKNVLKSLDAHEQQVDDAKRTMQKMHIERLSQGICTLESGAIYLALSSQLERVADHMTNIAYTIVPYRDKLKLGDIKPKSGI